MNKNIREQIKLKNNLFTTEDLLPLSGLNNHVNLSNNRIIAYNDSIVGMDISKESPDIDLSIADESLKANPSNFAIPYIVKSELSDIELKTEVGIDDIYTYPLTFESGQVIGIILGDGWWDKKDYFGSNRTLYIADLNGNNAEYVINFFQNTLNVSKLKTKFKEEKKENDDKRYGDTRKYFITFEGSTNFTKWLSFNFGGERSAQSAGSMNKRIPDWIFEDDIPLEFKKGIFNGLFATDGTISVFNIPVGKCKERLVVGFTSTSPELILGIEKLATALGIKYKSAFNKVTIRDNISYAFYPNLVDCRLNHIFDDIAELSKRHNWLSVKVETELASSKRYDSVVFPKEIYNEMSNYFYCAKLKNIHIDDIDLKNRLVKISHTICSISRASNTGLISRYLGRVAIAIENDLNCLREDLFLDSINKLNNYLQLSSDERKSIYTVSDVNRILLNLLDACFPTYIKNDSKIELLLPIRKDLARKLSTATYRAQDSLDKFSLNTLELIKDTCIHLGFYKTNFNKDYSLLRLWENEILNDECINWAIAKK